MTRFVVPPPLSFLNSRNGNIRNPLDEVISANLFLGSLREALVPSTLLTYTIPAGCFLLSPFFWCVLFVLLIVYSLHHVSTTNSRASNAVAQPTSKFPFTYASIIRLGPDISMGI
jgi:hypothetical protein